MERKLNIAIIGQGRSGKNIHGEYYLSKANKYYNVKYVVDKDEYRREVSLKRYADCEVFESITDILDKKDIDLVVNASYSEMHFETTKTLLENGFNVLVEKPFSRNRFECETLMSIAKKKGVVLAIFHNSQFAPYYLHALKIINEGKIGKVEQINIRFNGFSRRWDWQTMQRKLGGSAYNTGPHPICMALGFLDFDKNISIPFSKLARTTLTSGDAEDYVKIIFNAPEKPVVDVEISALDIFCDYNIKIQGSKGTFKSTPNTYELKYYNEEEAQPRPLIEESLKNSDGNPIYCQDNLKFIEEKGEYKGTAFDIGTQGVYENVYNCIVSGLKLEVSTEMACEVIGVLEKLHADNPLNLIY